MDSSLLYFILSTVISLIAGFGFYRLTIKDKVKTEITFVENSIFPLFKSLAKNLDDLDITYKGKRIEDDLIRVKCTFLNTGNNDIDRQDVHSPVSILLPTNFQWKNALILSESEGINSNLKYNEKKLEIDWDIFKAGEYITFDSIVEYKLEEGSEDDSDKISDFSSYLPDNLQFEHRITNLKNVNLEYVPKKFSIRSNFQNYVLFILFAIIQLSHLYTIFVAPKFDVYYEINTGKMVEFFKVECENPNNIILTKENGEELSINIQDFESFSITNEILLLEDKTPVFVMIMPFIILLVCILMLYSMFRSDLNHYRRYKMTKNLRNL